MAATAELSTLSATDRCDRCAAQAQVRVDLRTGTLFFCGHHARKHEARLRELAADIHDAGSVLEG